MRGLSSISSLFRNEFNKFNNTGGTNVRSFLSYGMKITLKSHFWSEHVKISRCFTQRFNGRNYVTILNL